MPKSTLRALCAFGGLVALAGCAPEAGTMGAEPEVEILTEGVTTPTNMMFVGANVSGTPSGRQLRPYSALSTEEDALKGILRKMDPSLSDSLNLGQRVSAIRRKTGVGGAEEPPQGMRGIGGIPAQVMLEVGSLMSQSQGGEYVPGRVKITDTQGQILDYEIGGIHGTGAPTDPGSMVVETWTTTQRIDADGDPVGPPRTERYRFTVAVEGGFQVKPRAENPDPDDMFPGTGLHIPFAGHEAFKYKIYARGQGIQVTEVAYDKNRNGSFDANEVVTPGSTVPGWHDDFQSIFLPNEDSCIDMMVQEDSNLPYDVPRNYAELQQLGAPPKYCLGRCEDPPLINTK